MNIKNVEKEGIGACCSLYCLYNFPYSWNGDATSESVKKLAEQIKQDMKNPMYESYSHRCSYMAVVTDDQKTAIKALESLGFKKIDSVPTVHGSYQVNIYLFKGKGDPYNKKNQ